MIRKFSRLFLSPSMGAILFAVSVSPLCAAELDIEFHGRQPKIAEASDEGARALKRFVLPPGLKADLWAAEPMLVNPVAFGLDEQGRCYVVETFRLFAGVTDIRGHMDWLDEELASQSVDDRVALMKRHLTPRQLRDWSVESERLRRLEDTDGDGKADRATVFAEGFNRLEDGLAAGVLARRGDVFFTCIPDLWRLRDTNADGVADQRYLMSHGYAVREGFIGHDLHGLRIGPDGRLYFSIGDRGFYAKGADGGVVSGTEYGAVFRCELDGSGLEVFHYGLRNPQELAFDDYGNLFTGDNNCDGGDQARWVYCVEGGDSGWRIGWQFIERPNSRGPWNAERMWWPTTNGQPAYMLPPIANIANGPSGLAYYPGTGLPERYDGHFLMADFRGGSGSGVHAFAAKPRGAGFELVDRSQFIWDILATDVDFGPDGRVYVSDWVAGWDMTGKGRIYRVFDPGLVESALVKETKQLLSEGFAQRATAELIRLLSHRDQRVRQEAQFALAEKGGDAIEALTQAASNRSHALARLHAVWALGQLARGKSTAATPAKAALRPLLADADPEVRAQTAKVLGDARDREVEDALIRLLADSDTRPRFFAAIALGRFAGRAATTPLLEMIRANADQDRYLRHAGVMGLAGIVQRNGLLEDFRSASRNESPAVRMAVLLTLRQSRNFQATRFLDDAEIEIVTEAARAIYDLPITNALPRLAALIGKPIHSEPLMRRVIAANARVGTPESASALAALAASSITNISARVEALDCLATWVKSSGRDRVTGLWRPIGERDPAVAANALRPILPEILKGAPASVRAAAIEAVHRLQLKDAATQVFAVAADREAPVVARIEAMKTLAGFKDARLTEALRAAESDPNEDLRKQATILLAHANPADALASLRRTLEQGSTGERQAALATLANLPDAGANDVLARWMDDLILGRVPTELRLDVIEAAGNRNAPELRERLKRYDADHRSAEDDLRGHRECLTGGNAAEGRKIFFERAEVQCFRCHKLDGYGGEAGPDLTGLGQRQQREYILQSILFPNAQIAAGFESVVITLKDGVTYAGTLKRETADTVEVMSPDEGLVSLKKAEIKTRERGPSAMPEELRQVLSKRDVRDLVEFLATATK